MPIGTPVRIKQFQIDAASQATIPLALATGASVGDLVVVTCAFGLGSTPTITCADNSGGGNTYQKDRQADLNTGDTPHSVIFSSILAGALTTSHTITLTFGTSVNYPLAYVHKVSGIAQTSWLDQVNSATGSGTAVSSGNITTTQADTILFGVVGQGTAQAIMTFGSGWTALPDHQTGPGKSIDVGYSIKAATGTYVYDGTITSSGYAACVASYKGAAAAGSLVYNPRPLVHLRAR